MRLPIERAWFEVEHELGERVAAAFAQEAIRKRQRVQRFRAMLEEAILTLEVLRWAPEVDPSFLTSAAEVPRRG